MQKSIKELKKEIIAIESVLLNPIITDYKRKRAKEDIERLKKEINIREFTRILALSLWMDIGRILNIGG